MKKYRKILTPFLMGQRRNGLSRVRDIDSDAWEIVDVPEFKETEITDTDARIERMSKIYLLLSERIKEVAKDNSIPVSIAGDCVSTQGVLAGLQKAKKQPNRILWLDAHGDFHTWETTQTKYIGGMPLAMLVGRGDQRIAHAVGLEPYPENQIILSDARDLDPGEHEAVQSSYVVQCDVNNIIEYLSRDESLYLHLDTDVIDAEGEMPALKYHVQSGPTYSEIDSLFQELSKRNLVAISVSAWHEEKDRDNMTARAVLKLLNRLGVTVNLH